MANANATQFQAGGVTYDIKDTVARQNISTETSNRQEADGILSQAITDETAERRNDDIAVESGFRNNIFNVNWFENGAISESTGGNVGSSERIRSKGYIPTTARYFSSSNSNINFMLYAWNRSGQYVGALQENGTIGSTAATWHTIDMAELYTNDTYKNYNYKVVIRMTGGSVQIDTVSGVFIDSFVIDTPENSKQIEKLKKITDINLFDVADFENGSIAYSDGSNVSSSSRIRTKGYISDTEDLFYSTDANIRFQLYAWDASGNYVGALNNKVLTPSDSTPVSVIDMAVFRTNANYFGYKYRVIVLSLNGNVTVDNVSNVVIGSVSQSAYATSLFDRVQNVSSVGDINSFYLWENGGLNLAAGIKVASPSRARTRNYIPTNAGVISFGSHTQYRGMFIAAYDIDGTYIGAYRSDGTFVKDGTETGWSSFDMQDLYRRFPGYRYMVTVYVRNGGSNILPEEYEDWHITNAVYARTSKLKVIQYNAGKWNMGFSHSSPHVTNVSEKILNYKEFFANENPDILFMQEFTDYLDPSDTIGTDSTLFNPFFINKSYVERETAIKSQYPLNNTHFSYLHTTGDDASWCIYGESTIDGKTVAVVSGVLNVSAPEGVDHSEQQIRALTKLTTQELQGGVGFNLDNYDYAIIGMDTNCLSQTEADTVKAFMEGKGYVCANWGYFGVKDTYNLSQDMYHAIDNVFIKGRARLTNFNVPSVYNALASDHFPVIAEFVLY